MKFKIFFIIVFSVFVLNTASAEQGIKDFKNFKNIPVLNDGRIKPLDTLARSLLTQFSGKDHYEKQEAIAWVATLFFNPDATKNNKIFLINNPDIATALNIPVEQHRRYTPGQLQKSYRKLSELQEAARNIPEKERSLIENEILRVFDNINVYADFSRSFLFVVPQNDFTITSQTFKTKFGLRGDQDQFSFLDLALKAAELEEIAKGIEKKTPSQYTSDEIQLTNITSNLFQWSNNYRDMPFIVIPTSQKGKWLSPWDAIRDDFSNEQTRQLIMLWNKMSSSFEQGNDVEFNVAAHLYLDKIQSSLSKEELKSINKFSLELLYQSSSPFTLAILFYIFAFIMFIISFSSSKQFWYRLALFSVIVGFIPHSIGLVMRIIIMDRPPVSSLYETFIFVGFISVLLGLIIEHYNRQWLGIVTAAISGTAMLFIANKYSADGDTLKRLAAVLNSNF